MNGRMEGTKDGMEKLLMTLVTGPARLKRGARTWANLDFKAGDTPLLSMYNNGV
jgi:hypothetical protein